MVGSPVMTVRAEKSQRLPIRLPRTCRARYAYYTCNLCTYTATLYQYVYIHNIWHALSAGLPPGGGEWADGERGHMGGGAMQLS